MNVKSVKLQLLLLITVLVTISAFNFSKPVKTNNIRPHILLVIADDWSWPHAGIYGDKVVKTPNFDKLANEGALFIHSYCASPSCTPSRAAILTGQYPHRLAEGGNLWGTLPKQYANYVDMLEANGYYTGFERKGWGPGNFKQGGYARNPAGNEYKNFEDFINAMPVSKPFCYWFGSRDPHREYDKDAGKRSGLDPSKVQVPGGMPDVPVVRDDILDYYYEVERFDKDLGKLVAILSEKGQLDNTLIVVTSDNGMPFPRAKANLYDYGTHMPLLMYWKGKIKPAQVVTAFVSHVDLAPTFLDAAGQAIPKEMSGKSILPLITKNKKDCKRDKVFFERERHANVRKGDLSYPARAVRTKHFLYIRNFRPDRWPAGDPETYFAVGPYGDVDDGPSKQFILQHRQNTSSPFFAFYKLGFDKRPLEELYDLSKDPQQLNNVAANPGYRVRLKKLRTELDQWMRRTNDPRISAPDDRWDKYPYYGVPVGPDTYNASEKK